jgi:hypothetical protein
MKAHGGSGGTPPPFLTLALDGSEWSASYPSHFTPQGNCPHYPLDRRLGGPLSWSGHCGEKKNLVPAMNQTCHANILRILSSGITELYLLPPSCWFLAWLTLQPWRWRRHVPLKCQLTYNGLHGIISQKTEFLIITTERSNMNLSSHEQSNIQ